MILVGQYKELTKYSKSVKLKLLLMKFTGPILKLALFSVFILIFPSSALAATLSLSPASGTFNKGCPVTLDINLDTTGSETDGTDAILIYDNTRFTATSIDTELPQKIYSDFPGSNIDDTTGKVTISGLASVSTAFNGKGTLAKVNLTVKETAPTGATQVKFDFDANDKSKTIDSNVVQRGTVADILTSVTNGNYTIGTGSCPTSGTTVVRTGLPQGQTTIVVATPAAQPQVIQVPLKQLPDAGSEQLTFTIAIVGSILTVLGVLGLALL